MSIKIKNEFRQCTGKSYLNKITNGSLEYLAPEIIEECELSPSVDWWSLGVLSYELLVGINPFAGTTIEETRKNIMRANTAERIVRLKSGQAITRDAYDFIWRLLRKLPAQRLGGCGVEELKQHPFLNEIDMDSIENAMLGRRGRTMVKGRSNQAVKASAEF